MKRDRLSYALLIITTIALGLGSRQYAFLFPPWVKLYLGDFLWSMMVFWILCFLFRTGKSSFLAIQALGFSFLIEISQLYHAPWIDSIRANRLGSLVLGSGFLWSDLVSYSLGIGVGFLLEKIINKISYPKLKFK